MATYGRISSGDKTNIVEEDGCATDEWGVRYQGHSRPEGGLFGKEFSLKSKCEQLRRRRCLVVTVLVVGAVLLTVLVVVLSRHRSSQRHVTRPFFKKWSNSTDGNVTVIYLFG